MYEKTFVIGSGGTCSNSGKTTLAVLLLKYLTQVCRGQQTVKKS